MFAADASHRPTGRRDPFPRFRPFVLATVCFALGTGASAALDEKPLAPKSATAGSTMFTLVSPESSGVRIENRYADPEMWSKRYHEFEIGAIGTGVAIGDYDNDGKPDLFIVSKTESSRLFRNLGNWKFEDVSERAGVADMGAAAGIWKQGASFADLNNDGLLDLYVCRFDAANLLYINQGNGTFKESGQASGLDVKDATTTASFCDYDRDGWLDVYIQTNLLNNAERPSGQRDYLFHNDGDGTFTNVTDPSGMSAGSTQGNSATWWDYNNDGWPDLYVANDFAAPDMLYRNNRDGTFTNVVDDVVPHMTYSSMGADVGDVNNDGLMDFMVADMAATDHQKDQRTMADTRARTKDPAEGATAAPTYLRNALYLNTGTERCLEAAYLAGLDATDWTWSLRFEDLDNDGRVDLHVTNGMHREIHNTDLIQRMMTAEGAFERVRIARTSPVLAEPNLAYRNLGDLRFESIGPAWGLDHKGVSFGAAFGDLDGDGDLDIVYTNFEAGATVLRNDSANGHRVVIDLRGTVSNRFGVGAAVLIETASGKQLRQVVLGRGYMSSSEPIIHFGLGSDTEIQRLVVTWPSGHTQTFAGLGVDRRFTITEPTTAVLPAGKETPTMPKGQFTAVSDAAGFALLSREEPVDEIAQQRFLPMRLNRRGPALAVGTLQRGGDDFVFVGGTTLSPTRILWLDRPGHFSAAEFTALKSGLAVNDGPLLVFDANADGLNDVLITRGGASLTAGDPAYQPMLWLNDGQGSFAQSPADTLPPLLISVGTANAADFNRDGQLDLFIGGRVSPGEYPLAPASALLLNRGGKFEEVSSTVAPGLSNIGMVTAALWSDVDSDTWPDLLLTLEWGQVKYFHNSRGRGFEDWTEKAGFASAGTGWWTGLAAADFNADGRPDYVAGNVGLNTPYRASTQQPTLLMWGDFKGGGTPLLIEGYYEGDRLYSRRTRRELGAAIPAVLKRFPRNDAYARSLLTEILDEKAMTTAERFSATELRSGVFMSGADGTYRFAPLPRLVQIAPLQGLVTGDFDGDGKTDIYSVQNSYAPNPVVGRFDGGLSQLLRGDGTGSFQPVPHAETQLVVPGDAKALVTVDMNQDGWPDFLVTRNNGTTFAFQNNGVAERHSLRVALQAKGGNPSGIGAKIIARYRDGSIQSVEMTAGSGYYSQPSAAGFFGSPNSNPLQSLEVRWPSGTVSTHPLPEVRPSSLTLSEPSP